MAWTPPRRVYRIEPETGHYAGFKARVGGVPMGQFMSLANLADALDDVRGANATKQFAEIARMFDSLGDALIDWNVELPDDGDDSEEPVLHPVPADATGIRRLDFDLVMWLFGEWIEAMGTVSAPLATTREQGESSKVEESTLMSLSQPLPS